MTRMGPTNERGLDGHRPRHRRTPRLAWPRRHPGPDPRRDLPLRRVRRRLPLLHWQERERALPQGRARRAHPRHRLPSLQQHLRGPRREGAPSRRRAPLGALARGHGAPGWLLPRCNRARVAPPDLRGGADHRHQPFRHHVLSPRRIARLPRHHRPRHALPLLRLRVDGIAPPGPCRSRGDCLVVLALRRCGVGRGLHRGLRDRALMAADSSPRASARSGGSEPELLESPAPTAWPMALAFGVTLIFGGLVTNLVVSLVGIVVSLAGAIGWWRQVLPVEQIEEIALPPVAERLRPIAPSTAPVERFRLGKEIGR